ncbi:MAG: PAS domain S-box protein [Sedimentisphaerales bacterium]|nr:PAS domain S-box protein [Sedimentisphaerales bacterium]
MLAIGVAVYLLGYLVNRLFQPENIARERTKKLESFNQALSTQISETKQAQEELVIFKKFAEHTEQGFGMADLSGYLTYANPALCRLHQESDPGNSIGQHVSKFYDDQDREWLRNEVLPQVIKQGHFTAEISLRRLKGPSIPTMQSIFVIRDEQDQPICLANVITDISKLKQAEEEVKKHRINLEELVTERTHELEKANRELQHEISERKRSEKEADLSRLEIEQVNLHLKTSMEQANLMAREAEQANKTKSTFLANISHEIRTPMNAILGFSDILYDEKLTLDQRQHVSVIRNTAENLLTLINDLLDFSKIEAGKFNIEHCEFSLLEFIQEIKSLMLHEATKKQLDFKVNYNNIDNNHIRTDPVRLRQCLINLLSNAIKFTEHGHVYLNVSILQRNKENILICQVEDIGIGIPIDKQTAIFSSFTQADNSISRKFGGTGLGLTITSHLAELLGGSISLDSEPGKGSKFTIGIPIDILCPTASS